MRDLQLYRHCMAARLAVALLLGCGGPGSQHAPARMPGASTTPAPDAARSQVIEAASATPEVVPAYFATLVERAQLLSQSSASSSHQRPLPKELRGLDYQQYRSIRFRPERSLWRGEPGQFEAQFFHLGLYYQEPVHIYTIDAQSQRASMFPFSSSLFSYDRVPKPADDATLGFAGLRLHAPLNSAEHRDEIIVLQGASYFRTLARGEVYGLSARGLAIDTGEPGAEEFPRFSELYLVRPGAQDRATWVLALLESRRATGAYAFRIQPGDQTTIEVDARVFLREPVKVLGLAPLTSMFLFGEEAPARFQDFRPEVHDSDGLAMRAANGEWIYRPLRNPERTTVCSFRLDSPRGFGLVQRDRDFASYQDLEARYQDRPSIWIEPLGDWGPGALRLLEISTKLETDDNIAMLWVPDSLPQSGLSLRYRMHVGGSAPAASTTANASDAGRVVATRMARTKQGMRFLVDFASARAGADPTGVHVNVSVSGGEVVEQHIESNSFTKTLRASFEVVPNTSGKDVELRAFLRHEADVLTETWSYLWQPAR